MHIVATDVAKRNLKSSFLSCDKDLETIWRKLLVESKPHSDILKRLLIINTPDCLDDSQVQYRKLIEQYSSKKVEE